MIKDKKNKIFGEKNNNKNFNHFVSVFVKVKK